MKWRVDADDENRNVYMLVDDSGEPAGVDIITVRGGYAMLNGDFLVGEFSKLRTAKKAGAAILKGRKHENSHR